MGLKADIIKAKLEAMKVQGINILLVDTSDGSPIEVEARYTRDAIVNFLTHDDLHFTISSMRASLDIEEFQIAEDFDADVKQKKVIGDKLGNLYWMKLVADLFMAMIEGITEIEIPVVGMKVGDILTPLGTLVAYYKKFWKLLEKQVLDKTPKTEGLGDINIPRLSFRKDGGAQGGELDARGHAYIGVDDIVKNSDTTDPENEENSVELYYDKIPEELL